MPVTAAFVIDKAEMKPETGGLPAVIETAEAVNTKEALQADHVSAERLAVVDDL